MTCNINISPFISFPSLGKIKEWLVSLFAVSTSTQEYRLEALFIEYVEVNQGIIDRICRSFSRSTQDFEDLRQDVLANIWTGLRSYRQEAALSTWIYRITLNTCVSTLRKRPKDNGFIDSEKASGLSYEQTLAYESAQRLSSLLGQLSVEDHSLMAMWLEDLPYEEIARVMGMNKNSVATRIHRSKNKIKKLLETSKY